MSEVMKECNLWKKKTGFVCNVTKHGQDLMHISLKPCCCFE